MLKPHRYIYRRQINPDGNFAAANMKTRRPDKEVFLSDGEGSFVARTPYASHLKDTPDVKEVRVVAWPNFLL